MPDFDILWVLQDQPANEAIVPDCTRGAPEGARGATVTYRNSNAQVAGAGGDSGDCGGLA